MGDTRNRLRHHGMIATSPGWRRHFPPARRSSALAVLPTRAAIPFWPAMVAFWASTLLGIVSFWSGRTNDRR